jgi:cytochrome b
MAPFRNNIYDYSKDRRYAAVFFVTLVMLPGLLIVGAFLCVLYNNDYGAKYGKYIWLGFLVAALLAMALIFGVFRAIRGRRQGKLRRQQLSRAEIRAARSKLESKMKPASRAMPRKPDIDLKY